MPEIKSKNVYWFFMILVCSFLSLVCMLFFNGAFFAMAAHNENTKVKNLLLGWSLILCFSALILHPKVVISGMIFVIFFMALTLFEFFKMANLLTKYEPQDLV